MTRRLRAGRPIGVLPAIAGFGTLIACTPGTGTPPPSETPMAQPAASASPSTGPIDLSGEWSSQYAGPSTGVVRVSACRPVLRWRFEQAGDQVTARLDGLPDFPDPAYRIQEVVSGRLVGTTVKLSGTRHMEGRWIASAYDVTYDVSGDFLRWNRDIRAYRVAPEPCPSGAEARPDDFYLYTMLTRGAVYDESGRPVPEARLWIQALHPALPFATSLPVANGRYLAERVPAGILLAWSVAKPGWTTRTRVETLLPLAGGPPPTIHFGGTETYGPAPRFFISNKPEVAAVEVASTGDDRTLHFTLRLSEPLDEPNRTRLSNAVAVVPVNAAALIPGLGGGAFDAAASRPPALGDLNHSLTGRSAPDAAGDSRFRLTLRWDEAGRVLTVTGTVPEGVKDPAEARYDVALFSGDDRPILDGENHRLGTDADGSFDAPVIQDRLLLGTFYVGLKDNGSDTPFDQSTAESRWRDTHRASTRVR
jgi:hypothetical protein